MKAYLLTLTSLMLLAVGGQGASIVDSKHNLALSGPGDVKAVSETEICAFCHTPHQRTGQIPLWNRELSVQNYTPYRSTTLKATDVAQPTGSSKLCLSCHDGTLALGMISSRTKPIAMRNSVTTLPEGPTRLGTDLSDDHPISFNYSVALAGLNPELKDPTLLTKEVRLDADGQMQCTSCHDPHNDQFGKFLVKENKNSDLCLTCHRPNRWEDSIHRTSSATWNGQGVNPWPHTSEKSVAANACASCHTPHNAGTHQRLLNRADEEQNCFSCHSGSVAQKNVQSDFNKFSVHPIALTTDVHDPTEELINPRRHVTCADCHNPHAVQSATATAPNASGALAGVRGVNDSGTLVNPVTKEYELCYRCHADSTGKKEALVPRATPQPNTRLDFAANNASFHPVAATGKNPDVPSLISPLTPSSIIYCTDCHSSDSGPGAGGSGAKGPHGSSHEPLLERGLALADFENESAGAYAMCYKCHSRDNILSDESFPHRRHVQEEKASCTTCHDSHGAAASTHLINFNPIYATMFNGRREFQDTGKYRGNCTLTCHGKDHQDLPYVGRGAGGAAPDLFRKQKAVKRGRGGK